MIEHLDRIEKLGFNPQLNWNKSFEISYDVQEYDNSINTFPFDIKILFCNYHISENVTYEEVIENSCDFFYMWYNKNINLLADYEMNSNNFDELIDCCLGDIKTQVYRDFNIDNLLD